MNPCESNYIFDIDKFASFEGNTGPYILYTMVRIKSILAKLKERHPEIAATFSGSRCFRCRRCPVQRRCSLVRCCRSPIRHDCCSVRHNCI